MVYSNLIYKARFRPHIWHPAALSISPTQKHEHGHPYTHNRQACAFIRERAHVSLEVLNCCEGFEMLCVEVYRSNRVSSKLRKGFRLLVTFI